MIGEIEQYAVRRADFGFETTLSGRTHLNLIRDLKRRGYAVHVFYLWVSGVELVLSRIRGRVRQGGHDVPPAVVRRRFERSMRNFFTHYRSLAENWVLFDNSGATPNLVALEKRGELRIIEAELYRALDLKYSR